VFCEILLGGSNPVPNLHQLVIVRSPDAPNQYYGYLSIDTAFSQLVRQLLRGAMPNLHSLYHDYSDGHTLPPHIQELRSAVAQCQPPIAILPATALPSD